MDFWPNHAKNQIDMHKAGNPSLLPPLLATGVKPPGYFFILQY
jgi:hypothetical protein